MMAWERYTKSDIPNDIREWLWQFIVANPESFKLYEEGKHGFFEEYNHILFYVYFFHNEPVAFVIVRPVIELWSKDPKQWDDCKFGDKFDGAFDMYFGKIESYRNQKFVDIAIEWKDQFLLDCERYLDSQFPHSKRKFTATVCEGNRFGDKSNKILDVLEFEPLEVGQNWREKYFFET